MTLDSVQKESALVSSRFKKVRFKVYMAFKKRTYQLFPPRLLKRFCYPRTILFYPDFPSRDNYAIRHICDVLGYRLTQDPDTHPIHMAVRWEDKTHKTTHPALDDIKQKCLVINSECSDISKSHLANEFEEVFGYALAVDPLTHQGSCVMKSDLNAQHDGQVVQCPIRPKEVKAGYVYQRFINSQYDDSFTEDIRVPVFKEYIPFVFLRYRSLDDRFRDYRKSIVAKHKVTDILSQEEINTLVQFCKRIGLDYGELDVLRDNNNKRIYIVDVNDTPWGEPKCRSEQDHWKAIKMMSETFEKVFIS